MQRSADWIHGTSFEFQYCVIFNRFRIQVLRGCFKHSIIVEASFRAISEYFSFGRLRFVFDDLFVHGIILSPGNGSRGPVNKRNVGKLALKLAFVWLLMGLTGIVFTIIY